MASRSFRSVAAVAWVLAGLGLSAAPASAMPPVAATARAGAAGVVHVAKVADSAFDPFTRDRSHAAFINRRFWRMRVYSPYFDSRTRWYADGWAYKDLYAIYRGSAVARRHPRWILRDRAGRRLFIPFGCGGGTCPQYAADIGNASYRAWWIAGARAMLARGYRGLFIDDVNLDLTVGSGSGRSVRPIDPRTRAPVSDVSWRRSVARFTEEIRAALPGAEIVHNVVWFAGPGRTRDADPFVARELAAADFINIERGVDDPGLTGGGCPWGLACLLAYIDRLHASGHGVVLDASSSSAGEQLYGLAAYFLISSGSDALGDSRGTTPGDWWAGYDVDLGAPLGPRYAADGLLRRDFTGGVALLNPPGQPTAATVLGAPMRTLSGGLTTKVTLPPGSGAVLRAP